MIECLFGGLGTFSLLQIFANATSEIPILREDCGGLFPNQFVQCFSRDFRGLRFVTGISPLVSEKHAMKK
jgi:hypothetical protein